MAEKETAYKPEPVPPPPPAEPTEEELAEKLYAAGAGEKSPPWKEADLSAKLKWRAVAKLAKSRGPFEDPEEHTRMAEAERAAFQHVRDMAFADAPNGKPKNDKPAPPVAAPHK